MTPSSSHDQSKPASASPGTTSATEDIRCHEEYEELGDSAPRPARMPNSSFLVEDAMWGILRARVQDPVFKPIWDRGTTPRDMDVFMRILRNIHDENEQKFFRREIEIWAVQEGVVDSSEKVDDISINELVLRIKRGLRRDEVSLKSGVEAPKSER